MASGRRRTAVLVAFLAASTAVAIAKESATPVKTAKWAADLNAQSAAGQEWMKQNAVTIGRALSPVLGGCLGDEGDELTAFSIYARISRAGRVQEVVTDLDAALGTCMTRGAHDVDVPVAPRDDYWVKVNLAASL